MECTDIQRGLSSFVERYDSQTFIGSYRETTRASLLKDGLSTRANSLWKMAEYVIAEYDNDNTTPIESYLDGWKSLASRFGDQYLLLEESKDKWGLYDSQGVKLGDEDFISRLFERKKTHQEILNIPEERQIIYYGAPGSGKSYTVNKIIKGKDYLRTTFHPDTDYASFIGCYKPTKSNENTGITYHFVPQAFVKAYLKAWVSFTPFYLVIEEINRGNCAQIFGDIFQLLDRDKDTGESSYEIIPDDDLQKCLKLEFDKLLSMQEDDMDIRERVPEDILNGKIMSLPANMFIYATMNTSDQSLFPIDSAFKRRWSWKYVPIDSSNPDSQFNITIADKTYKWASFLEKVNERIHKLSDSEDKQMGNFFIKSDIDVEEFKSKVMFYLWSEVCKEYEKSGSFFKDKNDNEAEFTFNSLFPTSKETNKRLQGFMDYLEVEEMPSEPDWKEFDDDTNADSGFATLLKKVKDSLPDTIRQRSHITSGNKYLTITSNRAGYNYCVTYSTRSNMLEVRYELPRIATPQKVTEINDFLTSRSIIISGLKDAPGKTTDTWHRWWIETPISDEDSNIKWIKENLEMFVSKFEI